MYSEGEAAPARPWDVLVLGRVGVGRGRQQPVSPSGVSRALLGALAVAGAQGVSADRLSDTVWGARRARSTLTVGVHRLRQWLHDTTGGTVTVRRTTAGYALELAGGSVDAAEARDLLASASSHGPARQVEILGRALALWRGPALADVPADSVDPSVVAELELLRLRAVSEYARALLAVGGTMPAVQALAPVVEQYPLDERLIALWIEALAASGRQSEALAAHERLRVRLRENLGITPGPEVAEALRRVLRQEVFPDRAGQPKPCQLPPTITDFAGRDDLVAELLPVCQSAGTVALAGAGGAGKSTLALRLAHRVRERFDDGQLYADLRTTDPAEVLADFLRALGVAEPSVPAAGPDRAKLYRSLLADRQMLVVLDNASDERQVAPLLPGDGCLVLVTSRMRLAGLAGAVLADVPVLTASAALDLLAGVVGRDRVAAEPSAAAELVELCGRLPLAVRIAATRLAARPHWMLAVLVDRLRCRRSRLDELSFRGLSVRDSLFASYDALDGEARTLFGLLGGAGSAPFTGEVAGRLLGVSDSRARDALERLVDERLLDVVTDHCGRFEYRFAELTAVYAAEVVS